MVLPWKKMEEKFLKSATKALVVLSNKNPDAMFESMDMRRMIYDTDPTFSIVFNDAQNREFPLPIDEDEDWTEFGERLSGIVEDEAAILPPTGQPTDINGETLTVAMFTAMGANIFSALQKSAAFTQLRRTPAFSAKYRDDNGGPMALDKLKKGLKAVSPKVMASYWTNLEKLKQARKKQKPRPGTVPPDAVWSKSMEMWEHKQTDGKKMVRTLWEKDGTLKKKNDFVNGKLAIDRDFHPDETLAIETDESKKLTTYYRSENKTTQWFPDSPKQTWKAVYKGTGGGKWTYFSKDGKVLQ
jgi:hypothetical protein